MTQCMTLKQIDRRTAPIQQLARRVHLLRINRVAGVGPSQIQMSIKTKPPTPPAVTRRHPGAASLREAGDAAGGASAAPGPRATREQCAKQLMTQIALSRSRGSRRRGRGALIDTYKYDVVSGSRPRPRMRPPRGAARKRQEGGKRGIERDPRRRRPLAPSRLHEIPAIIFALARGTSSALGGRGRRGAEGSGGAAFPFFSPAPLLLPREDAAALSALSL